MPQLIPFYFLNEVIYTSLTFLVLLFLLFSYVLPKQFCLIITRISLIKI